jgi:hypothetical protein
MGDDQQRRFPRLAISDLIVLMLCVAFAFACVTPSYREGLIQFNLSALSIAPDLCNYFAGGLLLFALIVLVRQRIRRESFPLSPGQWIVLAIGPYSVLLLAAFLYRPFLDNLPRKWSFAVTVGDNGLFVVVIGLSVIASFSALRRLKFPWNVCLSLIQLSLVVGAVWCTVIVGSSLGIVRGWLWYRHLMAIDTSLQCLASATALTAVAIDFFKGERRDWLHYLAIVALMLSMIDALANWGKTTAEWWVNLLLRLVP